MLEKITHYAIPQNCKPCNNIVENDDYIPKAWESRYTELKLNGTHILRNDITGDYTPQGACTDGTYIYRALVADDAAPTKLQKIDMTTGAIVKESVSTSYGHANDMTYKDGKLYIAHSSSTSTVYEVDAETFELLATFELPLTVWGIDYDATNDLFLFGGVGSGYLSVYYPPITYVNGTTRDFSFMYRIKPQNAFYGMVRQGIHCDSNYIYIALDNAYGANIENEKGSRVMVYTWTGMFIKSIHLDIKEIEWILEKDGYLYIGTYEGRDANNLKSGMIYKAPFDLYPEQTVITGRPTDVSGGLNNLQRLPEGTNVRIWSGSAKVTDADIALIGAVALTPFETATRGVTVDENGPFRYLRFRFKGANQQVFDWYPQNNGVICLREVDITAAEEDTNLRVREMRLAFTPAKQSLTIMSNFAEEIKYDKSLDKVIVMKYTKNDVIDLIELNQVWGVV